MTRPETRLVLTSATLLFTELLLMALVIGYQDLVLVVAALYVLAWLFARTRWLADRALAT